MKRLLIVFAFITAVSVHAQDFLLAGAQDGLYKFTSVSAQKIWDTAAVRKIIKSGNTWFFLTDNGIVRSDNLTQFEYINRSLSILTMDFR